jgi:site-specific recombinase XerD
MPSHDPADQTRYVVRARTVARSAAAVRRQPAPRTLGALDPIFEGYLDALRRRRRARHTIRANIGALAALDSWLREHRIPAEQFSLLDCEHYFDSLVEKWSVATVRQHLVAVRAAYSYAVRHEFVERDPTADVRLPRLPDIEPETYTSEQLRAILAAVRTEREELLFHLFAFAGLRLGEAANLNWEQIETDNRQIKLIGKGGKLRLVSIHPVLQQIVDEQRPRAHPDQRKVIPSHNHRRGLCASSCGREVRALVDRAGVPVDGASHAFRKTVATEMHEQGVRNAVIDKIMGWAPRTVRDRHYLRIADNTMHHAIQTLYRNDPITSRQGPPSDVASDPAPELDLAAQLQHDVRRLEEIGQELRLSIKRKG